MFPTNLSDLLYCILGCHYNISEGGVSSVQPNWHQQISIICSVSKPEQEDEWAGTSTRWKHTNPALDPTWANVCFTNYTADLSVVSDPCACRILHPDGLPFEWCTVHCMCVSANGRTCLLKVNFESFSATSPKYIYVWDTNRTHLAIFQK